MKQRRATTGRRSRNARDCATGSRVFRPSHSDNSVGAESRSTGKNFTRKLKCVPDVIPPQKRGWEASGELAPRYRTGWRGRQREGGNNRRINVPSFYGKADLLNRTNDSGRNSSTIYAVCVACANVASSISVSKEN